MINLFRKMFQRVKTFFIFTKKFQNKYPQVALITFRTSRPASYSDIGCNL